MRQNGFSTRTYITWAPDILVLASRRLCSRHGPLVELGELRARGHLKGHKHPLIRHLHTQDLLKNVGPGELSKN
jgi:hypothetical protein